MLPKALCYAVSNDEIDVIEEWLRDGDVNAKNRGGETLLHLAADAANGVESAAKILRMVLAAGPDVNARNSNDDTPLHVAAYNFRDSVSSPHIGALLVDHGADIDARDNIGCTALMAVYRDTSERREWIDPQAHRALVSFLVARGARVDLRDHAGLDASDHAEASKWKITSGLISAHEHERLIGLSDEMIEMLHDVRAAGGTWQRFLHEPRASLDILRVLCQKGRAVAPISGPLARLFPGKTGDGSADGPARAELPVELFRHVLTFWRSDRDMTCDRDKKPWMFARLKRVPAHLRARAVMDDSGMIDVSWSRQECAEVWAAVGAPTSSGPEWAPGQCLDRELWRDIFSSTVSFFLRFQPQGRHQGYYIDQPKVPGAVIIHDTDTAEEPPTP